MASARHLAAVLCATLLLMGCGGTSSITPAPEDRASEQPVASDQPSEAAPSTPVRASVADLVSRLEVSEDSVRVVAVEEVTWRDGSLGCAKKGTMYTQALVDGSRITLEAEGERYEYHSGGDDEPFLCEDPTQ